MEVHKLSDEVNRFRIAHNLSTDEEHRRVWLAALGTLIVPLPNFAWRKIAITRHDAHHVITGFGIDAAGELQLAAWELGVGCYRQVWPRLLCLFLTVLGICSQPTCTMGAYRLGRAQAANYFACKSALLKMPLEEAKGFLRRDLAKECSTSLLFGSPSAIVDETTPQGAEHENRRGISPD